MVGEDHEEVYGEEIPDVGEMEADADVHMFAADDDAAAKELDKMKNRLNSKLIEQKKKVQARFDMSTYQAQTYRLCGPTVHSTKPARKRAEEASDQPADPKPKKFSHSTTRRRRVYKVLLETPEDDIDYQRVPLRDLILLAEHKERQTKKDEAAAAAAQATTQSNVNSAKLQTLSTLVERRDHSHFETVIERLKKMAAEERQNDENDDSIDLTGNEVDEEGTSHAAADDEAAKVEHVEEVEKEDDVVANEDTTDALKSDDAEEDDDDLFLWSQYKSEA